MKKIVLVALFALVALFVSAQYDAPGLCHLVTGEKTPSIMSVSYHFEGFESGDWIGVCGEDYLCYGAKKFVQGCANPGQLNGYGDDADTEIKDGFANNEVMHLFLYDVSARKYYNLSGAYKQMATTLKPDLRYSPMNLYTITNLQKLDEIQLAVNPELSEVVFSFIALGMPVITGGSDAVKLKFINKNTTSPTFIVALGKGAVEKRADGYYYKYAATDVNVVINAVGQNNFTGMMVTNKITLTLNHSFGQNAVFEDENIVFYKKGEDIIVKAKTGKAIVELFYTCQDDSEKKHFIGNINGERRILAYYNRFTNCNFRLVYYPYINGKRIKVPIEKSFTL